uniref:hypothetical protein n=1 Tax=Rheinheimera sp. TaxID=1869214 RepID=UPI0023575356
MLSVFKDKKLRTCLLPFVGMFFFVSTAAAQTSVIDEQLALADETKSTDFKKFLNILDELESKQTQLTSIQLDELSYLRAYQLAYSGNQELALTKLFELADRAQSREIRLKSYGLAINSLVVSRRYSEVFEYYDTFNDLLASVDNNDAVSHGLGVIAVVFNQINQFDLAHHYAERLIETTELERYRCIGMQVKAESLFRANDNAKFDAFYGEALQSCIDARQPLFAGIIRSYKIEQLIEQTPEDALTILDGNFGEVKATSYPILITLYKALYSKTYLRLGQTEKALKTGAEALSFIKTDEINYSVLALYSTLYEAAKALGNFKDALMYQDALILRQRTFENEKMAGLLAYQLAKAGVEVKNQRIALLDKDNELLSLQKDLYEKEARQNRLLVLILGAILLLATVLAYRGLTGRSRFKKIAEYDQLTGISNRYHFNNQAKIALDYCET